MTDQIPLVEETGLVEAPYVPPTISVLGKGILVPATNITALESVHISMLLTFLLGNVNINYARYIEDHKLERHFVNEPS